MGSIYLIVYEIKKKIKVVFMQSALRSLTFMKSDREASGLKLRK